MVSCFGVVLEDSPNAHRRALMYGRPAMHVDRLLMRVSGRMFDLAYRRSAQHRPRGLTPATWTTFF